MILKPEDIEKDFIKQVFLRRGIKDTLGRRMHVCAKRVGVNSYDMLEEPQKVSHGFSMKKEGLGPQLKTWWERKAGVSS